MALHLVKFGQNPRAMARLILGISLRNKGRNEWIRNKAKDGAL